MITETQPLAEVTSQAIKVLCNEIGVVNTVRFIGQFTAGYGNYTEERKHLLAGLTLDDIVSQIKQKKRQCNT